MGLVALADGAALGQPAKPQRHDLKPHNALDDARATLRLIQATAQLDPATLTWMGQEGGA